MTNAPLVRRRSDGTVAPGGASLNPSGRPKLITEIRDMAREHTAQAFSRIVGLIDSQDERVALAAAVEVINRGWGKPLVQTQSDVRKLDVGALYLEAMKAANGIVEPSNNTQVIEATITEETENAEVAATDEQVRRAGAAEPPVNW